MLDVERKQGEKEESSQSDGEELPDENNKGQ